MSNIRYLLALRQLCEECRKNLFRHNNTSKFDKFRQTETCRFYFDYTSLVYCQLKMQSRTIKQSTRFSYYKIRKIQQRVDFSLNLWYYLKNKIWIINDTCSILQCVNLITVRILLHVFFIFMHMRGMCFLFIRKGECLCREINFKERFLPLSQL